MGIKIQAIRNWIMLQVVDMTICINEYNMGLSNTKFYRTLYQWEQLYIICWISLWAEKWINTKFIIRSFHWEKYNTSRSWPLIVVPPGSTHCCYLVCTRVWSCPALDTITNCHHMFMILTNIMCTKWCRASATICTKICKCRLKWLKLENLI